MSTVEKMHIYDAFKNDPDNMLNEKLNIILTY